MVYRVACLQVAVHEGNRQEYVQQRVRYAVHGSRQKQLDALKKGYEDVLRITCPQATHPRVHMGPRIHSSMRE